MTPDDHTADPVRSQTARKPDASPTGDDTTAARRELLFVLLSHTERGILTDTERPLLRPLVEAEIRHGQAQMDHLLGEYPVLRASDEDRQTAEATVYRLRQAVREARAAALPRSELDRFVQQMIAILDTPSDSEPAPDDRPSLAVVLAELAGARTANAEAWQLIEMMKDLIGAERRIVVNAMGHREDQGVRVERCDHCGADHLADLDEAIQAADKRYGDAFPATADGPSRPGRLPEAVLPAPAELVVCSPLVNAACPGHVGPPYCDRAPSNPEPVATCTALYTSETGETWHCTLNAGHNGDHVQAEDGSNYWNDHVATYPASAGSEPQQ